MVHASDIRGRVIALTACVRAEQTEAARVVLAPFLLHDPEFGGVTQVNADERALTLHPRIDAATSLPAEAQSACAALGVRWCSRDLGVLSPAQRTRLFCVVFFSKSKPGPALAPSLPLGWRRVLSNFHPAEVTVDGRRFASVEHYFQGQKALCSTRPRMAANFELDCASSDAVAPDPSAAKRAGGRGAYRRAGAELDTAAWIARRVPAMARALEARWAQQPLFRAVLESTMGLDLLHFERSGAKSYWGGSIRRDAGLVQGENQLGQMLERLRDRGCCTIVSTT